MSINVDKSEKEIFFSRIRREIREEVLIVVFLLCDQPLNDLKKNQCNEHTQAHSEQLNARIDSTHIF